MSRRLIPILCLVGAMLVAAPLSANPHGAKDPGPQVHEVYPGQTLGMISKRYNISIEAICGANGIKRSDAIKPRQKLVIPAPEDTTGEEARKLVQKGKFSHKGIGPNANRSEDDKDKDKAKAKEPANKNEAKGTSQPSYKRYQKPARRAGYVILKGTGRSWSGYLIVKGNRISGPGQRAFRRVMYSWRTGDEREIDSRLIRLLAQVSDKFGGRPIRIVSGFREKSFARESKHKLGRACDFSVEGMPNEALRDYLHTLEGVGVGYYPNSSFVHLDVRPKTTHWTDHSAPGEGPRRKDPHGQSEDAGSSN